MRRLINAVKVGALFAVDFNADEIGVHHCGGGFILKGFVRHHMAPMAGGVADRKQNRLIFRMREGNGGFIPFPPMHGIVGVLQQVRTEGVF